MNTELYPKAVDTLPITPYLDTICTSLKASPSHFLILTAETAAGKSTAVPLALLRHFSGRIVMLEPRRLAVLAIANRVASLLGEEPGRTAGYEMHLESRIGPQTRFQVITEAILTRRLQSDPSLEGTSVVVIDEFHERSIHADLALAFLKEAMQLRNDLYVIVMSATIDTEKLSAYLGTSENNDTNARKSISQTTDESFHTAPVLSIPGRQFPVSISFAGAITPAQAVLNELSHSSSPNCRTVADNRPQHQTGQSGSILVFLPGISDIRRTAADLAAAGADADICILHSSIPFEEQRKILTPQASGSRPRVILSSAIAETSLTVPGVTVVIDSGLARINRIDVSTGMERLVTESESVFSADQRAGRAGRTAPGRCIRLWSQNDPRVTRTPPEILRTDLTSLVLECAQWGITSADQLSWLDPPPQSAWDTAVTLLQQTGCLSGTAITPAGKAALSLGIHPRLACVALAGFAAAGFSAAPQNAAQKQALSTALNCVLKYSSYADSAPALQTRFIHDIEQRLSRLPHTLTGNAAADTSSLFLLAGFPDRIARLTGSSGIYQFPSGRLASLPKADRAASAVFPQYIVAPEADAGTRESRIYSWEPLDGASAEKWLNAHASVRTETVFSDSGRTKLRKTEYTAFGALVLKERRLEPGPGDLAQAVCSAVAAQGIEWLPLSPASQSLLLRARFFVQAAAACRAGTLSSAEAAAHYTDSVEISSRLDSLSRTGTQWLAPFIPAAGELTSQTVYEALRWYLNGDLIDTLVPTSYKLPNGRTRPLLYESHGDKTAADSTDTTQTTARSSQNGERMPAQQITIIPVLEVIIQQIFGCMQTPRILGVPVLLKLLSPARRPLQITSDLEHFWTATWPEICKEMRGRYPRHNWDYRVISSADD